MKTLVLIAHPDISRSTSHQFLLSSGQAMTQADFIDLETSYKQNQDVFDYTFERQRLLAYDQIIFQFQLHWYQAPAILKIWMDQVFENVHKDANFLRELKGKCLGVVVIAGVKADHYQTGGREGRTISEVLSPYDLFARHFGMSYLSPLSIFQFQYMNEESKWELMVRYAAYLETGDSLSFRNLQNFVIHRLEKLSKENMDLTAEDQAVFSAFHQNLIEQADQLEELYTLTEEW